MIGSRRGNRSIFPLVMLGVFGGVAYVIYTVLTGGGGDSSSSPNALAVTPTVDTVAQVEAGSSEPTAVVTESSTDNVSPAIPASHTISDARILIPSLAVNAPIVQAYLSEGSWDVSNLGMSVGHLQGTTWVGPVPGNIVLSGHVEMSDGRQGVFSNLETLQPGDQIILQQDQVVRRYAVIEISTVAPNDLTPVRPTIEDRLTLITCDSYDFLQDAYLERTVIVAEPVDF